MVGPFDRVWRGGQNFGVKNPHFSRSMAPAMVSVMRFPGANLIRRPCRDQQGAASVFTSAPNLGWSPNEHPCR